MSRDLPTSPTVIGPMVWVNDTRELAVRPMSYGRAMTTNLSTTQGANRTPISADLEQALESHRRELTGYCYRMLGSPFEAQDAVQEAFARLAQPAAV